MTADTVGASGNTGRVSAPIPDDSPPFGAASHAPGGAPGTSPSDGAARTLPEKAADTTAENPWPLRLLSAKIGDYVARMSPVWVEGQIVQLTRRPGAWSAFLTLRDADADMSLSVTIPTRTLDALPHQPMEGGRVVVHAKATFWAKRGSLQMEARDIRPVGQGELLARLEALKKLLASEGLFDAERKRRLPFLPRCIGLICGRNSAAEKDVVENARRRWPGMPFEIREVPVQGNEAVTAVRRALEELDGLAHVDVIVITRGGGSFEDLLPFSNETLVRAVAAARTPIVSAIGHEVDTPLIDFVADLRASTPTDAAKRIVPDSAEEAEAIANARSRLDSAARRRVDIERRHLEGFRTRPSLASPHAMLAPYRDQAEQLTERMRRATRHRLTRAGDDVRGLAGQVRALSPQGTLERGYAVVQHRDGRVVTGRDDVAADDILRVRVARGDFAVTPVTSPPATAQAPTGPKEPSAARKRARSRTATTPTTTEQTGTTDSTDSTSEEKQ